MDTTRLVSCIQRELEGRKGVNALAFQNHLYGCFIVMEDLAQGILEIAEDYLTGNSLYLNLDTQFGQIGIRYYGFVMDGKAVLEDVPTDYREAWMAIFEEIRGDQDAIDRIEDEVIHLMSAVEECYFMNALEHDGSLSADRVEKVLYLLHPGLHPSDKAYKKSKEGKEGKEGKEEKEDKEEKKRRKWAMTRRQVRAPLRTRLQMTRRQAKK